MTTTDALEKAHQNRHSMATELKGSREKLADLRRRHIESVADGQPDVKLAVKVTEAEANIRTLEGAYELLGRRHREALAAYAEEQAGKAKVKMAELTAQETPITHRRNDALVEYVAATTAYEAWKLALGPAARHTSPQPPVCVVEGLPSEIRARVTSDPGLIVDPLGLEGALAELEAEVRRHGFPDRFGSAGNKTLYHEGVLYVPVLGRCRITWGLAGAVVSREVLTILAIEAEAKEGRVQAKPGATPAPIPQAPKVGISQFSSR